jgi:hypothetical protein
MREVLVVFREVLTWSVQDLGGPAGGFQPLNRKTWLVLVRVEMIYPEIQL